MFLLREPGAQQITRFIASQGDLSFSYSEVGATREQVPRGYTVDHNRIKLGAGELVFQRAVAALKRWKQFDLGWVKVVPAETPLVVGAVVAVQARTLALWSLSAARVVYLIDEEGPVRKFGFAYGTLPNHVERGEERFTIEWQKTDNSVWYDILAFSQPHQFLVRLGFPVARRLQKRFARETLAAMQAVSSAQT